MSQNILQTEAVKVVTAQPEVVPAATWYKMFDLYTIMLVIVAMAAITLVNHLFPKKEGKPGRHTPPTVLIAGPSGAGKTALYMAWENDEKVPTTVTSVAPNVSDSFSVVPKLRIVDCPGNEKLQQFTRNHLIKSNLKAVVFVVDAAAGIASIKAAAGPLMTVLESTEPLSIPVLIAANKCDQFSALSAPKIRKLLEEEITNLRSTKSRTLASSEDDGTWSGEHEKEFLGIDGKNFEFADLESKVDFVPGNACPPRLSQWNTWIENELE